jgi:hypothetical protein
MAVAAGDRFVLRRPSPATTIAGGIVLDPVAPVGPSRRRATQERLVALTARPQESDDARLALHGILPGPGRGAVRLAADVSADIAADALAVVAAATPEGVSLAELRATLVRSLRHGVTVDRALATSVVAAAIDALVADGRLAQSGRTDRRPR